MKLTIVLVFLATFCLSMISALPPSGRQLGPSLLVKESEESEPSVQELQQFEEPEVGLRLKRATCDLLSLSTPIGSLNHAACAAHCLAMGKGFRGGRCRDGVCHCRR